MRRMPVAVRALVPMLFRFEHKGPLKVGLIAQCPEGQRATMNFFDLKYRATRLEDIWRRE